MECTTMRDEDVIIICLTKELNDVKGKMTILLEENARLNEKIAIMESNDKFQY